MGRLREGGGRLRDGGGTQWVMASEAELRKAGDKECRRLLEGGVVLLLLAPQRVAGDVE